jgi:hypothetical protein
LFLGATLDHIEAPGGMARFVFGTGGEIRIGA